MFTDVLMVKLSRRMKDILSLLSKSEHMTRNHIVYSIERERWDKISKPSPIVYGGRERVLVDKVRVSYDRTLKRLRNLGLIEGGFPPERGRLSLYRGTLWRGYLYKLTDKGRTEAQEILSEMLKLLKRRSRILMNALEWR